ncbi:MAG: aldo/keto reductase [Chloroflexi bacterium]|nr:aldo/keto reductase [Chloroflexota bacterium]
MQYNRLGRSKLMVSKICLGTMFFGERTPEAEAFRIMDRALELGINFFDTANRYGGKGNYGGSETIIGKWFKQGGGRREQVVLATKVYGNMHEDGNNPNHAPGISAYKVHWDCNDSLRRLQTDHIDLYQVHHFVRDIAAEEFWGTFERLINDGKILYLGTSNFPGWGLAKFQMQAWQRGSMGLISEQTQYNLLNRIPELEVLPAAQDLGIGILAYMPLAGGLLTGKLQAAEGTRTHSVENEYGIRLGEHNQQFAEFSNLCRELGEKEHIVAIAWTLANPAVHSAIVGIRTLQHLDNIERAAELKLSPEVMARLDEIFNINCGRPLRSNMPAPEAYAW